MRNCPRIEELQAWLDDGPSDADRDGWEQHLEDCASCRCLVDQLLTGDEVVRWQEMWDATKRKPAELMTAHTPLSLNSGRSERTHTEAGVADVATHQHQPEDAEQLLDDVPNIRVVRVLGRGSFGTVLLAQDALHPHLAVKVLHPQLAVEPTEVERFKQEAMRAAAMDDENVVTIHHVGQTPIRQLPYIVMQYVDGETLRQRLTRQGRLEAFEAAELVRQAALGLQAAHQRGVIHRDVKPSNILIAIPSQRVKLTDFGLATVAEAEGSEAPLPCGMVGTAPYLSPEQLKDARCVDQRCDIYALGVVLYEALTGERPFRGTAFALYDQILHDDPPPPRKLHPKLDPDLEAICLKCLHKDMSRRYASAREFAEDLKRFLDGQPVRAQQDGLLYRSLKFAKRRKGAVLAGALVAGVLIVAIIAATTAVIKYRTARQMERERLISQAIAAQARRERDRRFDALHALTRSAAIEPSLRIQNEALAALALADLRLDRELPGTGRNGVAVDPEFRRYARSDDAGNVTLWRIDDGSELQQLAGFEKAAGRLQFSPCGRFLAGLYFRDRVHDEHEFRVWDLRSGTTLAAVPARINGEAWAFRPDGPQLAAAQHDGSILILDLTSDSEARRLAAGAWITNLAWHPDGTRLAASIPKPSQVRILDVTTGEARHVRPMEDSVRGLAWRADGRCLAIACGRRILLWTPGESAPRVVMQGHRLGVDRVVFNHAGDLLASHGWDALVRLWNPATGEELLRSPGENCIQFSPDDRRLLGARVASRLGIWEVAPSRELIHLREHDEAIAAFTVAFSPDGRWLASASFDGVYLWDSDHPQEPLTRLTWKSSGVCAFDPRGIGVFASGRFGVSFWPIRAGDAENTLQYGTGARIPLDDYGFGYHFCLSPAGRRLLAIVVDRPRVLEFDLEQAAAGREIGRACRTGHVAVNPSGQWAATGGWSGTETAIWSLANGVCERELETGNAFVFFSADGRWLLTGGHDEYTFWETGSWVRKRSIPRTGSSLRGPAAFSGDGAVVALATAPDEVRLIGVADGDEIATLRPPHKDVIAWIALSADSRRLAVSCEDGSIQLWRLDRMDVELAKHGLRWQPLWRAPPSTAPLATRSPPAKAEQVEFPPSAYPAGIAPELTAAVAWQPSDPHQAREWHETLAGLNRAIDTAPDQWELRRERGVTLARFAEWGQAAADFSAAIALGAGDPMLWYYLALTKLALHDTPGYREASRQLLDRFGDTDRPSDANLIVWTCALHADTIADHGRLLALSEFALSRQGSYMHQNTLGVIRFRAGQIEEAIRDLQRAVELHTLDGTPLDWLFLAMANLKVGRTEEARQWLERARTWLARPGRELSWIERVEYHCLFQEAQRLAESAQAPG